MVVVVVVAVVVVMAAVSLYQLDLGVLKRCIKGSVAWLGIPRNCSL